MFIPASPSTLGRLCTVCYISWSFVLGALHCFLHCCCSLVYNQWYILYTFYEYRKTRNHKLLWFYPKGVELKEHWQWYDSMEYFYFLLEMSALFRSIRMQSGICENTMFKLTIVFFCQCSTISAGLCENMQYAVKLQYVKLWTRKLPTLAFVC